MYEKYVWIFCSATAELRLLVLTTFLAMWNVVHFSATSDLLVHLLILRLHCIQYFLANYLEFIISKYTV